jgi:hypothetical protein
MYAIGSNVFGQRDIGVDDQQCAVPMAQLLQGGGFGAAAKVILGIVAVLHDACAACQRLSDDVKQIRPRPVSNGVQAATAQQSYRFQIRSFSVCKLVSLIRRYIVTRAFVMPDELRECTIPL